MTGSAKMRADVLGSSRQHIVCQFQILQARRLGEFYVNEAQKYLRRGDNRNALAQVIEGLCCIHGPFYLASRDELEVLHSQLTALV